MKSQIRPPEVVELEVEESGGEGESPKPTDNSRRNEARRGEEGRWEVRSNAYETESLGEVQTKN